MRILIVSSTLWVGGAERLTVAYAEGLVARGHEVHIAHGYTSSWDDQLDRAGVSRTNIDPEMLFARRLPHATAALRRVLHERRPDVIFAQSVTTAGMARLVAPTTPIVVMLHGLPAAKEQNAARILRAARARVVAVSQDTADQISRHPGAPSVRVVRTGVDVAGLQEESREPLDEPLPDGSPRFVYVGRLAPEKRVDDLIRGFARVVAELPHAQLVIVGAGGQLEPLQALAAELGVAHRVVFVGFRTNVEQYVGASDVMVLSSEREGLPVALLEGFALGRPAVATAVGSVRRIVREGETGWLVPPHDPAALGEAMLVAGRSPDEARRRGAEGYALVLREYSATTMMDRIEQVLTEALSPLRLRPAPYYAVKAAYRRRRIDRFRRTRPNASPEWRGVRILAYHRVSDDDDPLAVSARDFEAHLDVILRHGIETVPLADAVERLDRAVEERVLCITFDDGYLDNLKVAAPLLARRGLPATVFIASRILDSRAAYYWYGTPPPAMTLDDVRRLIAEGRIDVQPHTLTHPALPRLDDVMARREISACKAELETMLGRPMTIFSYPAGLHGPREIEMVREAQYRAAVTTIAGVNPGGTSPFTLRRTMVPQATDGTQFEALLSGAFDSEPYLIRALRSRLGGPAPSRP